MATHVVPDARNADAIEIDLTKPYHREFATHILGSIAANLSEEMAHNDVAIPYIDAVMLYENVVDDYLEKYRELEDALRGLREVQTADSIRWRWDRDSFERGARDCFTTLRERLTERDLDVMRRILDAVDPIAELLNELGLDPEGPC